MADQKTEGGRDLDLFGMPLLPLRDRRGRPSFKKSPENQQFVALRAAAGWTQDAIAADMGIDPKTLRKNFSRELSDGVLMIEGQHLDVLSQRARAGNVSAIKALTELVDKGQRRRMDRQIRNPDLDEEEARPTGKKADAARAARAVIQGEGDAGPWASLLTPGYDQH